MPTPAIFVCYAHEDGEAFVRDRGEAFVPGTNLGSSSAMGTGNGFVPKLLTHLREALDPETNMFIDSQIPGGSQWERYIQGKARKCNACFILITPGLAGSVHVALHELPMIRQLYREGKMVVVPIYLKEIDWNRASHLEWLRHLQILPGPSAPLDLTDSDPRSESVQNRITRCLMQLTPARSERLIGWFRQRWIPPAVWALTSLVLGLLLGWLVVGHLGASSPLTASKQGVPDCPAARPQIQFISLPAFSTSGGAVTAGTISGRVSGVDPSCCRVVVYSKTNRWYIQPLEDSVIDINPDRTWSAEIHLGSQYAALLVTPDFKPQSPLDTLPTASSSVLAVEIK